MIDGGEPAEPGASIRLVALTNLPTRLGEPFDVRAFLNPQTGVEHLVVSRGPLRPGMLVRLHSECLTGDALGSLRCDCGDQLQAALARIHGEGGALLYLRGQEGRGIGLANKIRAYAMQDQGHDTVSANEALGFAADARVYDDAAAMLLALGVDAVRLLTNNPVKALSLAEHGVAVIEEIPLLSEPTEHNRRYLNIKRSRMGHRL